MQSSHLVGCAAASVESRAGKRHVIRPRLGMLGMQSMPEVHLQYDTRTQ